MSQSGYRGRFRLTGSHVAEIVALGLSFFVAVYLVRNGALDALFSITEAAPLQSVVAGSFFTSVFTTAPAIAALAKLSQHAPLYIVATFGALGAVCGDLFLIRFTRSRLVDDLLHHAISNKTQRRLEKYRSGPIGWMTLALGAFIIASPLPDELGLMLMGFTVVRTLYLIPISFVMNFTGIVLIGLATAALG